MKEINRPKAVAKLRHLLLNPEKRSVEGAPVIILKDGRHLMVETRGGRFEQFIISQDFGSTCRELDRVESVDQLLTWILEFAEETI